MILYTDIDPACCAVLEARVADGSLPADALLREMEKGPKP